VLAVTLWIVVTLNTQSYTTAFDLPLKLINFPDSYQLTTEFPSNMKVYARGEGIKLLYQQFDPGADTFAINFEDFGDRGFFYSKENLGLINQSLQPGLQAVWAQPDSILLTYAPKSQKRVPVIADIDVDIPPSYRLAAPISATIDSVQVIGPLDSLKNVRYWKTARIKTPRLVAETEITVPLQRMETFQVSPKEVTVKIRPLPYTEKTMKVPVKISGLPSGTMMHLSPDSISVKLLLPVDDYEHVQEFDVRAEVNYKDVDFRSNYMIPMIAYKPSGVFVASFAPQLLEYVVITKE
jgi:YbbR domain-containing protein